MNKQTINKMIESKHFPYFIISVFSLITIIPLTFLIRIVIMQVASTEFNGIEPEMLDKILNQTLLSKDILTPFLIGFFAWTVNAILSVHYMNRKKIGNVFAFTTILLGGLGLHIIIYLIKIIKESFVKKDIKITKLKYTGHIMLGTMIVAFISPLLSTLTKNSPNAPVTGHKISMSLDPKKPNIIEIFSDGFFRRVHTYPMSQSKDLKDFTIYDKYISISASTYSTVPSIWGNLGKYNPMNIGKENPNESYVKTVQTKSFFETFMQHMGSETDPTGIYKDNISIVNPINITTKTGYNENVAGSVSSIKEKKPNWNITNWAGARNSVGLGINGYSPDVMSYRWLNQNMVASKTKHPARIFTSDLITHPPIFNNADGTFKITTASRADQWKLVRKNIVDLTKALKSIKDPSTGITAYDNTLIVIYGDHKDHTFFVKNKTGDDKGAVSKESLLLIKYPKEVHNKAVISDRVVYSPQINAILKDFIANQNPNFINKTPMFAPNSSHWVIGGGGIIKVHYGPNKNHNPNWTDKETWEHLEPKESLNVDTSVKPITDTEKIIAEFKKAKGVYHV